MNQNDQDVVDKAFLNVPTDISNMSREELAVTLHGFVCKARLIELEWESRESFVKNIIPEQSECPSLTFLFGALEDYRHLAMFEDCRHQLESVGGIKGTNGGCVYVVEFSDGHIKIGNSINPHERIKSVAGGNQAVMLRSWVSDRFMGFAKIEREAHKQFREFRVGGEFFTTKFEDAISWIQSNIGMNA